MKQNENSNPSDSGYSRILKRLEEVRSDVFAKRDELASYVLASTRQLGFDSGMIIADLGLKIHALNTKIDFLYEVEAIVKLESGL